MGSRTTFPIVTDGYLGANFTSDLFTIDNYPLVSIHYWMTGTPSGTLTFQVSDFEDTITDGYGLGNPNLVAALSSYITQWTNLASVVNFPVANAYTAQTITSGSPANGVVNLQLAGWKWMRLVWTNSSGTGTLQARCKGKRFSPTGL